MKLRYLLPAGLFCAAASGVSVTMAGNNLQAIPQFVGDGTTDALNVITDGADFVWLMYSYISRESHIASFLLAFAQELRRNSWEERAIF